MNRTDNKGQFPTPVRLIFFFLKGSIGLFVLSMIFSAVTSFLDMMLPRVISFTVDSIIGDKAPRIAGGAGRWLTDGGLSLLKEKPWLIALIVCALALAGGIFRYLSRCINEAGAQRFIKQMRDRLYEKIEHLPYAWHGENSTGDIIQRCTSDVENVKEFVSEQLTSLVRVIVLIILAVSFMAGISPRMTLIASVFIPVVIGYSLFFYTRIGPAFEKADVEEGILSAMAQENLTGVRVVRAFGREAYERQRFETQNRNYTGYWVHLFKIMSANWVTGDVMTGLQYLLVNIVGAVFCVRGDITPGQMIAFVSYNAMLTWPVRSLGRVISEMSKAGISLDRLRYIMNTEEEKDPEGVIKPPMDGDICFENVSFSYSGGTTEALHDVSMSIKAGSTVGILGTTGSGKSTLMYLLEKLYPLEQDQGRITIGGTDIRSISTPYLRSKIGMVLQEPYLFSRSLAENISVAAPGAGMDMVRRASGTADLIETVDRFGAGFDTFVGERGVTLSGGQKQRTAIAQMLIRECPIMIFDDSLSAVDAETDARIRRALERETGDATVILIAHRITTLMHADRIFLMEQGRVIESGTHDELLTLDGVYRKIYDLQSAGKEGGA